MSTSNFLGSIIIFHLKIRMLNSIKLIIKIAFAHRITKPQLQILEKNRPFYKIIQYNFHG